MKFCDILCIEMRLQKFFKKSSKFSELGTEIALSLSHIQLYSSFYTHQLFCKLFLKKNRISGSGTSLAEKPVFCVAKLLCYSHGR